MVNNYGRFKQKIKHMSYITSFVQTQSTTKVVATENKTTEAKAKASTKNNMATKVLLFVGIITCLVLAVII